MRRVKMFPGRLFGDFEGWVIPNKRNMVNRNLGNTDCRVMLCMSAEGESVICTRNRV